MLDFIKKTVLGVAAAGSLALTMGAGSASAVTISSSGVSGNPNCTTGVGFAANTVGTIDVLAGASFNAEFADADVGSNFCFNFVNTSLTDAVVTLAVATVNQGTLGNLGWGFLGGVQLVSVQLGNLWTVAQGVGDSINITFTMAAGETVFFDWIYGDPYASSDLSLPEIDFVVLAAPVPLPAGGLLLIGALGGLAALRRRKSA